MSTLRQACVGDASRLLSPASATPEAAGALMTITRADVTRDPSGLRRARPVTTAHHHIARFYLAAERQHRSTSWVERIAAAPSPFSVEGLVADFVLFGGRYASPKVRAQVQETARVRICELRGLLP
jgi:hypothetical protein